MAEISVLDKFKAMPGVFGLEPQVYREAALALQRRIDWAGGSLPDRTMNDYQEFQNELQVANRARHALYQISRAYSIVDASDLIKPPLDGLEILAGQVRLAQRIHVPEGKNMTPVVVDEPKHESIFRDSLFDGTADSSLSKLLQLISLSDQQYTIYQGVQGYAQAYTHARAFIHAIDVTHRALVVECDHSTSVFTGGESTGYIRQSRTT